MMVRRESSTLLKNFQRFRLLFERSTFRDEMPRTGWLKEGKVKFGKGDDSSTPNEMLTTCCSHNFAFGVENLDKSYWLGCGGLCEAQTLFLRFSR